MTPGKVSVIIPSRNGQPFLQKTIDELLTKAEGDIEIIVVCDGMWPVPSLNDHPKVTILHHGTVHNSMGMREGINRGIAIAQGEYIMKIDEHCMVDRGYDTKLKADCDSDWVVIPRRFRLDAESWTIQEYDLDPDGLFIPQPGARPPVDYMYLAYPYERPFDKTCGLHGAEWKERAKDRADIQIDDTMSWQGSCYFTTKKFWDEVIGRLDTESYGTFTQEAQEIGNKTWLSGGRLVVNKKTWYAHMHKGKKGKGYGFSNEQYKQHMEGTEKGRRFCIDYWTTDKHLIDHPNWKPFSYLMEKFWPVPTWPENWQTKIVEDAAIDYANLPEEERKDWYANNA